MQPHKLNIPSIQEIRDRLNEHIVGQTELIDTCVLFIYKHLYKVIGMYLGKLNTASGNLLIMGKTGTGKTATVKKLSEILDIPFIEINGPSITQEGWHGISFKEFLEQGIKKFQNLESRMYPIIYIDEFDKLCAPQGSSNNLNHSVHIQASILKYIEGFKMTVNQIEYDTSNFCFIFSGSFNELEYKITNQIGFESILNNKPDYLYLTQFGLLPEIIGRINRVVKTNDFTKEMYRDLVCNPNSSFNQWFSFFKSIGINRDDEPNWTLLIEQAFETGLGARGLMSLIEPEIDKCISKGNLQKIWDLYLDPEAPTKIYIK